MKNILIIIFILTQTIVFGQNYIKKNIEVFNIEYPKEWELKVPGGFGESFQLSNAEDKGYGHITGVIEKKEKSFLEDVNKTREDLFSSGNDKEISFTKINETTYKISSETIDLFDNSTIYRDIYLYDYKNSILEVFVFYNDKSKTYFTKDALHFINSLKFK